MQSNTAIDPSPARLHGDAMEAAGTPPRRHHPQAVSHTAPWYFVPRNRIVSVEHPFIVKNVPRALQTLGGPLKVGRVCVRWTKNPLVELH
jgi:hypothetical protein